MSLKFEVFRPRSWSSRTSSEKISSSSRRFWAWRCGHSHRVQSSLVCLLMFIYIIYVYLCSSWHMGSTYVGYLICCKVDMFIVNFIVIRCYYIYIYVSFDLSTLIYLPFKGWLPQKGPVALTLGVSEELVSREEPGCLLWSMKSKSIETSADLWVLFSNFQVLFDTDETGIC